MLSPLRPIAFCTESESHRHITRSLDLGYDRLNTPTTITRPCAEDIVTTPSLLLYAPPLGGAANYSNQTDRSCQASQRPPTISSSHEVCAAIEDVVVDFVHRLCIGGDARLVLRSLADSNVFFNENVICAGTGMTSLPWRLAAPRPFVQLWLTIQFVYELMTQKKRATLRQAYYCMADSFSTQHTLNACVVQVRM